MCTPKDIYKSYANIYRIIINFLSAHQIDKSIFVKENVSFRIEFDESSPFGTRWMLCQVSTRPSRVIKLI